MGEYFKNRNINFKLGTCEDLMYIRHSEIEALQDLKNELADCNGELKDYLKDGHYYRFPYPWEDGQKTADISRRNPEDSNTNFFNVPQIKDKIKISHEHIIKPISLNGTHNVNVWLPCPMSAEFEGLNLYTSQNGFKDLFPISVIREKMVNGKLQTVYACPYCGVWFRMDEEETNYFKSQARENYIKDEFKLKIIERIK